MSIEMQKQIRDNANCVSEYMKDLYDWTEDMNLHEKKQKGKKAPGKFVPPPRGQVDLEDQAKQAQPAKGKAKSEDKAKSEEKKRDKTNMKEYYKSWDKYDTEAECEKLVDPAKPRTPNLERFEKTSESRPNMKIRVRTGYRKEAVLDVALALKTEANEYFSQGRYFEAVEHYTKALAYAEPLADPGSEAAKEKLARGGDEDNPADESARELASVLFANRALAHIRRAEHLPALKDCDRALELDPSSVKARFRRGSAAAKLKRWERAVEDLEVVVAASPDDKKAKAELEYVKRMHTAELLRRRERARKLICDKNRKPKLPLRRLLVGSGAENAKNAKPAPAASDAAGEAAAGEGRLQQPPMPQKPKVEKAPYVPRAARMRGAPSGVAALPNSYSFERSWQRAKPDERRDMLVNLGADLPGVIRESFSAELLMEIAAVLDAAPDQAVARTLTALPQTSRFHVSVGLLADSERSLVEALLQRVDEACPGVREQWFPDAQQLAEMD